MVGTTVSQYQILEKDGAGGRDVVYWAEDTRLNVPCLSGLKTRAPDYSVTVHKALVGFYRG